jgi:hypothetical protein
MPGEIQAANGDLVLTVDRGDLVYLQPDALALWIIVAINTCAGFRMDMEP